MTISMHIGPQFRKLQSMGAKQPRLHGFWCGSHGATDLTEEHTQRGRHARGDLAL